MIRSMTAYGRAEIDHEGKRLTVELRSLNNRYRDILLRLPRSLQTLEETLKGRIAARITRGRVEASIQMTNGEEGEYQVELNEPLVGNYMEVLGRLSDRFGLERGIDADTLLQMKDVIMFRAREPDMEKIAPVLTRVLDQALDSLDQMRIREGANLEADFLERLDLLERYVEQVSARAPVLVEDYRSRLREKALKMIEGISLDETRLAQEVLFFAERADVTEELVRMRSHIKQFREYLGSEESLGRRLEFLIQELNREANTLSSKASDSLVSQIAVEMKAELEKLREQAQNVE